MFLKKQICTHLKLACGRCIPLLHYRLSFLHLTNHISCERINELSLISPRNCRLVNAFVGFNRWCTNVPLYRHSGIFKNLLHGSLDYYWTAPPPLSTNLTSLDLFSFEECSASIAARVTDLIGIYESDNGQKEE